MGEFFHAVRVFGDQLAAVDWQFLALALGLHFVRLVLPRDRLAHDPLARRIRTSGSGSRRVFGAYVAGVGINSIAPARGGDVVKLYLIKHRIKDASLRDARADARRRDARSTSSSPARSSPGRSSIGALPTHQVYSRLPSVDWGFLIEHREVTGARAR